MVEYGILKECRLKMILNKLEKKNNKKNKNKMENLTTIVKGTTAKLTHVCYGKVYYQIDTENHKYQLEINSMDDEFKSTYLELEFKSITLMRWIRKGIKDGTFVQLT